MDSISVIFVLSNTLKNESEASDEMLQAYEACKQNKVNTSWVREQDIYKTELKKTDFIVFENFNGKDFESIKEKKSASILGPWCVLICLMEGKMIPNFQWPIYNVAMYNCIVTSSHLPKQRKVAICEKVQRMGGYYTDNLTENTTHLVTDSVKTAKYVKAKEMNVKVVIQTWVDAVWEASQKANIHCNDHQFNEFICQPFHKLIICSTGISSFQKREKIRGLVNENGGEFTGKLNLSNTDVLICEGTQGAMSEKYREARKTGTVNCVTLQWLYDSIDKGFCLPHDLYPVQKGTSTPQKDDYINPNFSTMSAIDQTKCDRSSVDDSMMPVARNGSGGASSSTNGVKRKECENLIEQIDIKRAKKSGQFLDGCSVYLVGFKGDHREKLTKIINASGATRCDDMSDRVTHVIVGDPEHHEVKVIRSKSFSCSLVNLHWLLDSIERKRPCNEEPYLVNSGMDESKFRSPLGKKGLNLLRSNRTITEIDLTLSQKEKNDQEEGIAIEAEKEIMKQYLIPEEDTLAHILKNANYDSHQIKPTDSQDAMGTDPASGLGTQSTMSSQNESQRLQIFQGLRFFITGFDDEQVSELNDYVDSCGGKIISNVKEASFILAPSFIYEPLPFEKSITISDIWVVESVNEEELLEIKYYHRPLLIGDSTVLEDCVVTISGFSGLERNFLISLIECLGGTSQEQFCRVTSVEHNILASTHLLTAEASGKKFMAAKKWGLPALGKDWLLECARQNRKLSDEEFSIVKKPPKDESSILHSKSKSDSSKENISSRNSSSTNTIKNTGITNSTTSSTKALIVSPINITATDTSPNDQKDETPNDVVAVASSSKFDINSKPDLEKSMDLPSANRKSPGLCNTPKGVEDEYFLLPPKRLSLIQRDPKQSRIVDPTKTPDNRMPDEVYSQVTPIDKIMKEVRLTNLLGTPESPQLAKAPWDVDTPETPYGAYIDPNPSKSLRKEMLRFLNQFSDQPRLPPRRMSTPLSELKRRLWDKIGSSSQSQYDVSDNVLQQEEETEIDKESCTQSALVNTRLQQLEEMMVAATGSGSKSRRQSKAALAVPEHVSEVNIRESQPCTVQWDFGKDTQEESSPRCKVFMISGVNSLEAREEIVAKLEELGATVSKSSSYDPSSTHLLCPKPARNEKTLSCMAAGKWILHTNYVEACLKAGKFLDEEDYEYGNPNSIGKISIELDRDIEIRMQASYFWRNEIARTGRGPFYDMRAILVAEKKQALISVIEAGGGTVIDAQPPFDDVVHATHCLIEPKSASNNYALYEPLARQGIYCVNTVYISDFLYRTNKDIKDSILPFFQKYFR